MTAGGHRRSPTASGGECTFADSFKGKKLSKFWVQHPEKVPLGPGSACKKRKNVKVRNGQLQLTVNRTKSVARVPVPRRRGDDVPHVQPEVRPLPGPDQGARTEETGLQEAFWLWPDDRFKQGEVLPGVGRDRHRPRPTRSSRTCPCRTCTTGRHSGDPSPQTAQDCKAKRGKWHIYTLLWGPKRIEIKVDGKNCLVNTSGNRAFKKRYILASPR